MKGHRTFLAFLPGLLAVPLLAQPQIGGGSCNSATLNGIYSLTLAGRDVSSSASFSNVLEGIGTATFDGLSLAWATVEYLHAETGARTLFATHYHELTMLAEKLPRVRNLRVGVKETAGGIVFLHSIEPGAASKSYGIEVARLAGLPTAVIERAKHVLRQHEKQERQSVQVETATEPMQLTIFTPLSQRIVDRIEQTDVNALTPLQALNLLEELQTELKKKA